LGADSKNCGTARISLERVTVARTGPVVRGKNSIDRKDQLARGGVKGWGELQSGVQAPDQGLTKGLPAARRKTGITVRTSVTGMSHLLFRLAVVSKTFLV